MIDVNQYIGLPYRVEARGPDYHDCWSLIRLVYRDHLGIELPLNTGYSETMTEQTSSMISGGKSDWREVEHAQPYDVVLFNVYGAPNHIGLIIAPGMMLHTTSQKNACIESYRRPVWASRIEGFYRHSGSATIPQ